MSEIETQYRQRIERGDRAAEVDREEACRTAKPRSRGAAAQRWNSHCKEPEEPFGRLLQALLGLRDERVVCRDKVELAPRIDAMSYGEPTLGDMLSDPIVEALMAADDVRPAGARGYAEADRPASRPRCEKRTLHAIVCPSRYGLELAGWRGYADEIEDWIDSRPRA
jgi:hypothetical protein